MTKQDLYNKYQNGELIPIGGEFYSDATGNIVVDENLVRATKKENELNITTTQAVVNADLYDKIAVLSSVSGGLTDDLIAAINNVVNGGYVTKAGDETITGEKTFNNSVVIAGLTPLYIGGTVFKRKNNSSELSIEQSSGIDIVSGDLSVSNGSIYADEFHCNSNDSDSYVLLAGGGTKALSEIGGQSGYVKPDGGIPKTDLASDVQTSLGKADTAIQPDGTSDYVLLADGSTKLIADIVSANPGGGGGDDSSPTPTYNIPVASQYDLGGIKIGYTTSGKNYAVQLDSNNKAFVNVPWQEVSESQIASYGFTKNTGTVQGVKVNGTTYSTVDGNGVVDLGTISGGGTIVVDSQISSSSTNPVENRAISNALTQKADQSDLEQKANKSELVNQTVNVRNTSSSTITSFGENDAITFVGAGNVTITPNASAKTITITGTGSGGGSYVPGQYVTISDDTIDVLVNGTILPNDTGIVTGGEIYSTMMEYIPTVDSTLSPTSTNAVQNKAIVTALAAKADQSDLEQKANVSDLNTLSTTVSGKQDKITSSNAATVKSTLGLNNVGNFKAVSTVASQGLTATEQANARANIGAGTSNFSGNYNDLTNKPTLTSGTVTSVAMTVPTGLSVSGSPITTSGTLALSFANGYSIPTTAKLSNWDTAYSWGNHAAAGYKTTDTNQTLKVGTVSFGASDEITLTSSEQSVSIGANTTNKTINFGINTASANNLGGIKLGYTQSGKNYPVAVTGSGQAYVNVPWTDTTYTVPTKVSQLTNDSGFTSNAGTITAVKMNNATISTSGIADLGNVVKTIKLNGTNLSGTSAGLVDLGNLATTSQIPTVDSALSATSTNAVQNKVINTALAGKADQSDLEQKANVSDLNTLSSTVSGKQDKITTSNAASVRTTLGLGTLATQDSISAATTSAAGLMSATDKAKLDGIASGATATTVDSTLSTTSTNPVQNKVILAALNAKADQSDLEQKANKSEIPDTSNFIIKNTGSTAADYLLLSNGQTIAIDDISDSVNSNIPYGTDIYSNISTYSPTVTNGARYFDTSINTLCIKRDNLTWVDSQGFTVRRNYPVGNSYIWQPVCKHVGGIVDIPRFLDLDPLTDKGFPFFCTDINKQLYLQSIEIDSTYDADFASITLYKYRWVDSAGRTWAISSHTMGSTYPNFSRQTDDNMLVMKDGGLLRLFNGTMSTSSNVNVWQPNGTQVNDFSTYANIMDSLQTYADTENGFFTSDEIGRTISLGGEGAWMLTGVVSDTVSGTVYNGYYGKGRVDTTYNEYEFANYTKTSTITKRYYVDKITKYVRTGNV